VANQFFDLPAPAGDGVGATVDTSTGGLVKTITVQQSFFGSVTIEFSLDGGTTWVPLTTFTNTGKKTFSVPASRMRVRRAGTAGKPASLPNIDVGTTDAGSQFLALPATAGDGEGAAVDVSALGTCNVISVTGTFPGVVNIQGSEDNVDWATIFSFTNEGFQAKPFVAQFLRVVRAGTVGKAPGTPVVNVGAADDSGGGGAGTGPTSIWAGGRETYDQETPQLVVGAFEFQADRYTFSTATFRAVAARGDTVNAEVELFNVTDAVTVATLTFSSTAQAMMESADITGSLPAASKIYEVRINLAGAPGASDSVELYKAELELVP
jgi:hypothetical protein